MGFAGLPVTISTLRAGKRLALANKESLIAAGDYKAIVLGTVAAYIAGNVGQKALEAPKP